jgi:hypothetical protein
MTNAPALATSLGLYLLPCTAALLAGHGLLRLLGLKATPRATGLLAPAACLVLWSVLLALAVVLRLPIRTVTPWLWLTTLLLAGLGLRGLRSVLGEAGPLLVLCAVLPVVVMARCFWHGLDNCSGSFTPDGWSYVAVGQYLWTYSSGTEAGLVPLYQYASGFPAVRQVSSALLGLLSPLVRAGDTAAVSSLLQAWTLFVMACAVAYFWTVAAAQRGVVVAATALATLGGWVCNLVLASNFDNGLALACVPALAGLLLAPSRRRWLLLGMLAAALLYTYPELALLGLGMAGGIALPRLWAQRIRWRAGLSEAGLAACLAGLLLLPGAAPLGRFALHQYQATQTGSRGRPGEGFFPGLLDPRCQPAAFWGLGGEHSIMRHNRLRQAIGIGASGLLAVGLLALWRQRQWGLALVTVFLGLGAAWFAVAQGYAYGAYKLILLDWWCLAGGVVWGADYLVTRWRWPVLRIGTAAAAASLATGLLTQSLYPDATSKYCASPNRDCLLSDFRHVRAVKAIVGDRPLLVAVEDWLANEWAVYFLRDHPLHLKVYRSYMSALAPIIDQARRPPLNDIAWVLTDDTSRGRCGGPGWRLAWSADPYRLWKVEGGSWVLLGEMKNVYGLGWANGLPFFWLGQGETDLDILTGSAGEVTLTGRCLAGPSLTGPKTRRLQVRSSDGSRHDLTTEEGSLFSLTLPVPAGKSTITLVATDRPNRTILVPKEACFHSLKTS